MNILEIIMNKYLGRLAKLEKKIAKLKEIL